VCSRLTYCSVNKVRSVSGLDSSDIGDERLRELRDEVATPELNEDVVQKIQDEKLNVQISGEKENGIDGSNKTFYLRGLHKNELQLGDLNDDGNVTVDDVEVYQIDLDDNRVTSLNVTLQDREIGKLKVEDSSNNALEEGNLFSTYVMSPADMDGYTGNDFTGSGPDKNHCSRLLTFFHGT